MQRRKQQERKKVCPHGNQSKENCYFCQMEADNGYSDNNEIERIRSSSRLSNQRKMRTVSPSFFDYDQNIALSMTTGHGLSRHWCSFLAKQKSVYLCRIIAMHHKAGNKVEETHHLVRFSDLKSTVQQFF